MATIKLFGLKGPFELMQCNFISEGGFHRLKVSDVVNLMEAESVIRIYEE